MRVLLDSLTAFVLSAVVSVAETKPNIVVINVDDLGWRDIEYLPEHDSLYPSPNIKQLAESGVVFTDAYAACPVCSPSRASLVTGKSPAALRLTAHIPGRPVNIAKKTPKESKWQPARSLNHLPLEEVTFAEVAKDNGYRTAFVGKWHLAGAGSVEQPEKRGAIAPEFHPDKQGFDVNLGGCAYGQPAKGYFDPHFNATLRDRKKGEYLTDRLTDEAVQWIEKQSDAPFLLYLNYYSVHTPIQAPADRVQLMRERGMSAKKAKYAAMVYSVDLGVGKLMESLREQSLLENTLVILTSDNGGLFSNKPLRDIKGTLYEGGIRVPFLVAWKGRVPAGKTSEEAVISYDIFPTLVDAMGGTLPADVEGVSLLDHLQNDAKLERDAPVFWHYPHYHHGGMESMDFGSAVRSNEWKFITQYKSGKTYLFNLESDLGEQKNVIEQYPEIAAALEKQLSAHLEKVGAEMPTAKKENL